MSLGTNLLQLRKAAKLTQEVLAERAGVQQSDVSKWEKGTVRPDLTSALKLAVALRCSLDRLLEGVDSKYDAARDLLSHAGTTDSGSRPLKGGANVPAEAHIQQDRRNAKAEKAIRAVIARLTSIAASLVEDRTATTAKTGSSKRDRKVS